jgi:cob(I)alamin adenosyltransferase
MLYTRKGDQGTTKVFGCEDRFSKASPMTEALGTLDELNSYLGLCRASIHTHPLDVLKVGTKKRTIESIVHDVQEALFSIQAEVAGADKRIDKKKVTTLETLTDTIEQIIPPLHSFSIAGGTYESALFDVARTIARKAERRVVAVHELGTRPMAPHTLAYLNRLSSLLFALARYANHVAQVQEEAPSYR